MGSEAAPREVEQGAGGELHGPDVSNGAVSEDSRGINEALQQTPAQAEAEVDDDEEDDEEEDDEEAEIQLGFAEEVERDDDGLMALEGGNWRDWDGGKIGGKPVRTWTLRECWSREESYALSAPCSFWCLTSCVCTAADLARPGVSADIRRAVMSFLPGPAELHPPGNE